MSSHKPSKRRKLSNAHHDNKHGLFETDPTTGTSQPAFPLVAFLWPARGSVSQWLVIPLVLLIVGLFRWAVGFWGYSGFQKPPMHGDFEAQRHWMEITTHLPISQWYFYDPQWWGLDYPPLTAYHSWILGKIGSLIEPTWFALDASRGLDDALLKVYMRATVFISEYITYIPALVVFLRHYSPPEGVNTWEMTVALVAILMQPATMLIDHAHFQYNTVMLGFVVASMSNMLAGRPLWSCVFFVAALSFKQMALYYAPVVFAYLLGICLFPKPDIARFLSIAMVTAISFALVFAPLLLGALYDNYRGLPVPGPAPALLHSLPLAVSEKSWYYPALLQLAQCIHRVFPFARGIFEDKVANIWCALHTFHKLHLYPTPLLQRISLAATAAAIAPPCLILFFRPRQDLLPWALATSAWAFFLCSFQVHEKSVLLPLMPMTVLLASGGGLGPSMRAWVGWANVLGAWTMYPLLKRVDLRVPYFVLTSLWMFLLGLPPTSRSAYPHPEDGGPSLLTRTVHVSFYGAMIAWHLLEGFVQPPEGKPDLWVVLNMLIGAAGFGVCYVWCLWNLLLKSNLLRSLRLRQPSLSSDGKVKSQ